MSLTSRPIPPLPSATRAQAATSRGAQGADSGSLQACPGLWLTFKLHLTIARPDHWFKNVFMVLGVVLAYFYRPQLLDERAFGSLALALAATCLIASSNYVLNEILDARSDRSHPLKQRRPLASGQVRTLPAYLEWLLLALLGLAMASTVNRLFLYSALCLLAMGLIYNVPPIRSKELPYLDVLTESINNPIRLMLGWFAVYQAEFPPVSLLIAYWMIGSFFMATKRFAEYRAIGDPAIAILYRSSFRYYDETKILISMFFYAVCFALFLGFFIVRYHLELILVVPLIAGFVCYYLHIAFKENSAAQAPEHLYREKGLVVYLALCTAAFIGLMFVHIPVLYELFNVPPASVAPLWRL